MAKYLLGLVAAGVVAFLVKSAADDMGAKLTAARQPKAEAPKPAADAPGVLTPFDDPLGYYRVMLPGRPSLSETTDSHWMHGIGRGLSVDTGGRKMHLQLTADFVGSDEPNSPRATLAWVVKRDLGRAQKADAFDRVKFSRGAGGAEVADFGYEWRGNHPYAHRTRHTLLKKWLYTLTAHGDPDGIDDPDVLSFFETFAVTDRALAHPDGGAWKP